MKKALITGDWQAPCHDPSAFSVMLQIAEDLKPDIATANGDIVEFRHLSMRYPALKSAEFGATARDELESAKGLLAEFKRACGSKCDFHFNEGNHEWRLFRALSRMDQILQILNLDPKVHKALSVEAVFGLQELGFKYSGEYPAGHWLFDISPHKNVFVHHGYLVRQKAGYQANAETDKRMVSTVTGHGERLGIAWRRDLTDRDIVACEGGNLSKLGEPKIGAGIYTSVPFNAPEMLDRKQGFIVIYQDGDHIQPVPVQIKKGKAIFGGKIYRA